MGRRGAPSRSEVAPLSRALSEALEAELGGGPRALGLVGRFLRGGYGRSLALELLDAAAGRAGDPWEVRRVAALLLQGQILLLSPGNLAELDVLLTRLGVKPAGAERVHESVLREGYTTRELGGFGRELRRRLSRAVPVFARLAGERTRPEALRDLLAYARKECRLELARYLFSPHEVAERVVSQVRVSRGVPSPFPEEPRYVEEEAQRVLAGLPEYEAQILDCLRRGHRIFWVAPGTSSELSSLVEYPVSTVVLTVKPPGSDHEFEIKRAGCRGRRPDRLLGVVYERAGKPVPGSHRLDGGSMGSSLHFDARSSALLARIYRAAHGEEAPISRSLAVCSIHGVPIDGRVEHICDYFTYGWAYGKGFGSMRRATAAATAAFAAERSPPSDLPGELGRALRFLQCVCPAQSLLAGTSSFRLDRVALYLSPRGPRAYFRQGLGRVPRPGESRRLADEVLAEILGVYYPPMPPMPPALPYRGYGRYVAAAFAHAPNRTRADRVFVDLMRQIGTLWGTLYGAGGCSWGESFVARNVGLRSRWEAGRWRVRIAFMDHDQLHVGRDVSLDRLLEGMREDRRYILGDGKGKGASGLGEVGLLEAIYRVDRGVARCGRAALRAAARRALDQTAAALRRREVRPWLRSSFLPEWRPWDDPGLRRSRSQSAAR